MRLVTPHRSAAFLAAIALLVTSSRAAAERAAGASDPRWHDLPHTDTVFAPRAYGTLAEWQARREHLRQQILWAAGLLPMPEKTPMNPQIFGRLDRDGYTVEKVYFESYPGFLVTGNLYRPTTGGRHPGVACPHGHWGKGRLAEEELGSVPARCITLARLGCVVFSYDMVGYNDSGRQIRPHNFNPERAALWGFNILGLQLWNSIRVVDFLCSLPEVDAERIGCTGASGGGTQTFLLCAVDDRVKVSAPVNMISSTMQGGCVCENAPCLRLDTNNMEIGAMMAPRPMIMVSATGDWTKLTPKVEFPAIRDIYRLYDAADRVSNVQIDAPHNYNKASREAVYRWFGKWLLGRDDMDAFTEPPYPKEKDADLLVFADRPLPVYAVPTIETLLEWRIGIARGRWHELMPGDAAPATSSAGLVAEAVRLATGCTPPAPDAVRFDAAGTREGDGVKTTKAVLTDLRRKTRVPVIVWQPTGDAPDRATTLLVHGRGKAALAAADEGPGDLAAALLKAGHRVVTIDAFGIGESTGEQDPRQPRGSTRFFTTFNRTDAAERVCDTVTAITWCLSSARGSGALNLVGIEQAGPWCALAATVMSPPPVGRQRIRVVIDANRFDPLGEGSYLKDLFVPGLLRIGGLPAAIAAIPPAPLLFHNTGDRQADFAPWLKAAGDNAKLLKEPAGTDQVVAWIQGGAR